VPRLPPGQRHALRERLLPRHRPDGGFAQYLLVKERNLVRLPDTVTPKQVAPHADAGLTAYHAANKAVKILQPGDFAVIIGFGGLGHIAYQVLAARAQPRSSWWTARSWR